MLNRVLIAALLAVVVALSGAVPSMGAPKPRDASDYGSTRQLQALVPGAVIRRDRTAEAMSLTAEEWVKGRYLVIFREDVPDPVALAESLAATFGLVADYVYPGPIKGFAAKLDDKSVAALQRDTRVTLVQPQRVYRSAAAPTGIRRIGAELNGTAKIDDRDRLADRVDADVVVIDTGIDGYHPDLNFAGGGDCYGSSEFGEIDSDGHGTHVAGTIGALDNGIGVVGVAPGVRLWSIRAGGRDGLPDDALLCAFNAVVANTWIDVVNMSFGSDEGVAPTCTTGPLLQAICRMVRNGTTVVVAAGNDSRNSRTDFPSGLAQVIAVSALADSDGRIGGLGGQFVDSQGEVHRDDGLAAFSNYGSVVDISAPGVDVLSTRTGGGYIRYSGTSMAAPHVAGAAALIIARDGRIGPDNVKKKLIANSDKVAMAGDPDGVAEPILYVGALDPGCTMSANSGRQGRTISVTCTKFRMHEKIQIRWNTASGTLLKTITADKTGRATGSFDVPSSRTGDQKVVFKGATSGRIVSRTFTVLAGSANLPETATPSPTSSSVVPTAEPTTVPSIEPTQPSIAPETATPEPTNAPTEVAEPTATAEPPTEVPTADPTTPETGQPDATETPAEPVSG